MMAGRLQSWRMLRLLILVFSLFCLTEPFEVREDEWEELDPDIAALHRLSRLSEHMFHERLENTSNQRDTSVHKTRVQRSRIRVDKDQNPMSWQETLQECEIFPACAIRMEQYFNKFLEDIDEQKVQDWLLSASEISHSYSQKLLVVTDNEKSTNDRAQQEYKMDPHYSIVVSKECLHNESCVLDADSDTVVKIFGSVSEDGQTVSGLSGSSMADLILKSSLEAASVFSLDGNTTTEFQHDIIRVFMVRGIRAVLETRQEKHQIYQVMNQPGSVSHYRIPERPVDHTTQYDHQQILMLEDDITVRKAAIYLYEKHPTVSSVYVLDENQKPKLIHGNSAPLSEDSRLVLVGHGGSDNLGEMKLARRYGARDLSQIVEKTYRVGNEIKTISIVGCDVGSNEPFIKTLVRELHETAGIKTEVHLRNTLLQVRHTGEKITQEISADGTQWRHKDDSTKVVAMYDRNGEVVIRNEPGSIGEAVFTNERNLLGLQTNKPRRQLLKYRDSWPDEPKTFIDPDVFNMVDQNKIQQIKYACDELQGLSWGLLHSDQQLPKTISVNDPQEIKEQYLIGEKQNNDIMWINDEHKLKQVLGECYEIKSGKDVRNIIRHYAKKGEDRPTHLMVNDWIYVVDHKNLYMYPVGKRLDNNQRGNEDKIDEVKKCITEQRGKESYPDIRDGIHTAEESYAQYVTDIFHGTRTTGLQLSTEAWCTTYFCASVIAESARNFRTFPLVLMALDMFGSNNNNNRDKGLRFLFKEHSMARGFSWIDPSRRGFSGSATPVDSSKLKNRPPRGKDQLMKDLAKLVKKESDMFKAWQETLNGNNVWDQMDKMAKRYGIFEDNSDIEMSFLTDYWKYKNDDNTFKPIGDYNEPPASGTLGGYEDGHVKMRDLISASELENTFKHESYFLRTSASFAEEIHSQLKARFGEDLAGLHLQEGRARVENGEFVSQLVSKGADAEPVEFRAELSTESQQYHEKMLGNIDTAVHDMETQSSKSSHGVNKYAEHAGTAVGSLGLLLGMKGAVRAFEQGHIKEGVVGSLQTTHGVTAMTSSVIARQALSAETRIGRVAAVVMRSPAMKGVMTVIPVAGIGFGVYNLIEDFKRGDALGYIDGAVDSIMVGLDVLELAQPELAPFIMPINLALSVVRMVIDDVYMGIQGELNSLPKDAGVLEKLMAVVGGFEKGIEHFRRMVFSLIYDWRCDEIEEGQRYVAQISDYHKYYNIMEEQHGASAVDFSGGASSWNGGGIDFCLADDGLSAFCMDYFVSSDQRLGRSCEYINTQGSNDIILGVGESHQLEYKTIQEKLLMFIPTRSVTVVSGYKSISNSRYGKYKGNRDSNRFFAVQKAVDQHMIEVMLSYYYKLHGEPGDDIFFLGPQRSYVEGAGGKDTYIVPENGGKTIINNYDPFKNQDVLHFSVDYGHISVSKSGDNVVLMYEGSHTVTILNWFLGEPYRHMNMMSGDGVLFEISSTVVSSVQLVARGINKMFMKQGATVNASWPLLCTASNIFGSQYDDVLIGNGERNLIDGGGGEDLLMGGEGEDTYIVKDRKLSSVVIENYSRDSKTDLAIIEANLHEFEVIADGDDVVLKARRGRIGFTGLHVKLVNWFRSPADRHLLFITKDLITFTISDDKTDCLRGYTFIKCIKSRSIDYSSSTRPLVVDLEEDKALDGVTEVRGSEFDDRIQGNKEHNVIVPGSGDDYVEGRGGEDWYVITPGKGVKTINNQSPDGALDVLFLKEEYLTLTSTCEGRSIVILVHGRRDVVLHNWFDSKRNQHLQIRTSDGVTAGLTPNISSCGESLMSPLTVDYRNQEPSDYRNCYKYSKNSMYKVFCYQRRRVMTVNDAPSVRDMYGTAGFDIMVGNSNENLLDPYTGGALMFGGEGKDTYKIKLGYEKNPQLWNDDFYLDVFETSLLIDNFAEDQNIDTVLVDMDFLDGSQVSLDSSTEDVTVTIVTKGETLKFSLLSYKNGPQHQHLEFQSSDGVRFLLRAVNLTGDVPSFQIEAFKVTLTQSQVDCRLDLGAQMNLSKVHTVQGCPSRSNDVLGNNRDNVLMGGWKDDALDGGEGDDTLIGGIGDDILIGGIGDDTLYGEDGNDTLMGNSGWDVFIPGPGADLMDGGPGRDTVLYRGDHEKGQGVYVNLLTGQGRYADAEGDVLKDVETVVGTIYADVLVSGYESSLLKGSDGNDVLVSTDGDYLVGGDGNDIYMLAFNHGSVTIDNCAKDNATDVLYLNLTPSSDCQVLSDRVLLTFAGLNQTTVNVALIGWTSDDGECGHLVLMFRELEVSVDKLLQESQRRQKKSVWSSIITRIKSVWSSFMLLFEKDRKN
ncbi:uncharacterized protein [Embiotoca jacksoni]|uniref:uncharacterized protein n=1 Tax=Embiotoca jacksoni TaxID=100190 RepID=UPI003704BD3C